MNDGDIDTVGPEEAEHFGGRKDEHYWHGSAQRIELIRPRHIFLRDFAEAQGLYPQLTEEQVRRFIPNSCVEIEYVSQILENR